ncbi:MAG: signal peptidase II [Chlamydiota bacterium]|jgi:signal peptidase II
MNKKFPTIFLPFFLLDFLTKYYTYHFIPKMSYSKPEFPYGGIKVFQKLFGGIDFSIVHVENLGAAWGIFSAYSEYLLWARLAIIGILFIYLVFFIKETKKQIPIIMIITGAAGNILDFPLYGHVIDMMYFKFWDFSYPIFNVADCMITCGIFLLFFLSLTQKKTHASQERIS